MQLKLDVKTLVVGVVLGIAIAAAIGAGVGSADAARFGIAIEPEGAALVQASDGGFYIVNPKNAMAVRVLEATSLRVDPEDSRDAKGRPLGLGGTGRVRKTSGK
ncbi:MAG: hypothetical protein JSV82_00370 [Planctomycetota bacterium]|nr:MAG: hypothetical protein JSV82_00370 [Planctomycetota bacterium]